MSDASFIIFAVHSFGNVIAYPARCHLKDTLLTCVHKSRGKEDFMRQAALSESHFPKSNCIQIRSVLFCSGM